jgi:hypothetical protein
VAECRKALTLDPDDRAVSYNWLARCLEQQGKRREAIDAWTKRRIAQGDAALAERMRQVFVADGWEAYWRAALRQPANEDVVAAIHVRLGNVDEAMRTLEAMFEARVPHFAMTNHPEWDPLRVDSRLSRFAGAPV